MPIAITTSDDLIRTAKTATVYTRENWSDDWEERELLFVDAVEWTAAPTIGTAQLSWRFGKGLRQREREFAVVEALDLNRHWVKIEIDQTTPDDPAILPKTWHGQILTDDRMLDGALLNEDDERIACGQQTIRAYDLKIILDRQHITTSFFDETTDKRIGRGLTFNEPDPYEDRGNRSMAKSPRETYVFCDELNSYAEKWSTRQIVAYLLAYHAPVDFLGNDSIEIKVHPDYERYLPDDDTPELASHGRTLKQLLDNLLDRRRLLGWTLDVEAEAGPMGDDRIRLIPFTFADEEIELPGDREPLPANLLEVTIDFDFAVDVDQAQLKTTAEQTYDQVIARGERILCVGTLAYLDGTLLPHWTGGHQTEYDAGASTQAGYGALEVYEKQQRNADYRAADHLARVYRYFGLPDQWDGEVGNGEGGAKNPIFPYDDLSITAATNPAFWPARLRLERFLPLKDGYSYQADPAVDNGPALKAHEYRRPIVLLQCQDEISSAYQKYQHVERLAVASKVELTGDGRGRAFSCSVRTQDDAPGLIVSVSGAPQHAIAAGTFAGIHYTDDDETNWLGSYTYKENLLATVCLRADCYVEKAWPEFIVEARDALNILEIDARRVAELHYLAPNTVVDLEDGDLKRAPAAGMFVRDDRDLLEALARIAYEWYGRERQALTLAWKQAAELWQFEIGDLVVKIGAAETEQDVRTVITAIRVEFGQSDQQPHRSTIETQWAELDVLSLI